MSYFFSKTTEYSFEEAQSKTTEALKAQGFGVLTEIDVKETFKNKLDKNFRQYNILGACNPQFAYKALQTDGQIGLLLPCNVVIQETQSGHVEVSAINPEAAMSIVDNPQLAELAKEVGSRLAQAMSQI